MKVLSLFDGISCARVALDRLGATNVDYHASEIDRPAMHIAMSNFPGTLQVGDVTKLDGKQYKGKLDLLIGGSPCQDLSVAKSNRAGLKGARSGLFYQYVRILKEAEPKWFVLENVASMPKEARDEITKELGVEPIMIDAQLVSAQRRKRLFWTNIPTTLPADQGIYLRDILEDIPTPPDGMEIKDKSKTLRVGGGGSKAGDRHEWDSVYQFRRTYWRETKGGKVPTLTANMGTGGNNVPYVEARSRGKNAGGNVSKDGKTPTVTSSAFQDNTRVVVALTSTGEWVRKLTVTECERLQSLPDGYTMVESNTQRYKALGNAFNAKVIEHILAPIVKKHKK